MSEAQKRMLRGTKVGVAPKLKEDDIEGEFIDDRQHLWLWEHQAEKARNRKEDPQEKAEAYISRIPKKWVEKWKNVEITKEHWCPERSDVHTKEFREFISSHIPRFDKIIANEEFYLYLEQARRWLDEGLTVASFSGHDQWDYVQKEFDRMNQNSLYAMDKYGWIKDDKAPNGRRKYYASTPQALIIFCMDRGHSLEIGKGRQAAITSTVMLYECFKMLTTTSYKGVLVTDDIEFTGKNIFNDKLKACYQYLARFESWIKPPKVPNYSEKKVVFDWSEGSGKDTQKAISAEYSLAASNDTQTINGTTPSKVVFDETQNIETYLKIKLEARPTMLSSGEDGTIRIARQLVAYGTGSSHQRGKGAFENEYKSTIRKWSAGEDTSSFVPLFLDWTCRPNMTRARYLEEQKYYLNSSDNAMNGLAKEERESMFHAAMPSSPEDMFMTAHKTIVSPTIIRNQKARIYKAVAGGLDPIVGRFVPVYDYNSLNPESFYVPFKIVGAKWEEAAADDLTAPVKMFLPPEKNWVHRYYQGTDPIQSSKGTSRFASVIWDQVGVIETKDGQRIYNPMPVCVLNDRQDRVEESYLQSKLMGMYYANYKQTACMEVTERNQGQDYENFIRIQLGLEKSLWLMRALPKEYQGGSHTYGIDLKQGRKGRSLFYDTVRLLTDNAHNIWYHDIWTQVEAIDVEERDDGTMDWGVLNKNTQNDDLVIALSYANISARSEGKDPKEITSDTPQFVYKKVMYRDPQTRAISFIDQKVPVRY